MPGHVCEGDATEQHTAPESEADEPHQYSSYLGHISVTGLPSYVSSSVCQTHKVRLLKTSHEPSPTTRRPGRSNPKEIGYTCALEVAKKTCQ